MVGSGLAAFCIWLVKSSVGNLILSCVFGAVSTMGFNALDCLGVELFPSSVRLAFDLHLFIFNSLVSILKFLSRFLQSNGYGRNISFSSTWGNYGKLTLRDFCRLYMRPSDFIGSRTADW